LGDGIELWENRRFDEIFESNKAGFLLLRKFFLGDRLHLLYGNHDQVLAKPKTSERLFNKYFDSASETYKPLLPGFFFEESIVVELEGYEGSIFLLHGHQADFFNYVLWRLSRFLVRYLWTPLQVFGIKDPTSPAKNNRELVKVEKRLREWSVRNGSQMMISGHTHRPRFPSPGDVPYFNAGSCVHPASITGIEIDSGRISLVKWHVQREGDGSSRHVRTLLEGPENLEIYLKKKAPQK
jgi:UDP-2,3-diacylglucosamine pyrophosphatase LpxH